MNEIHNRYVMLVLTICIEVAIFGSL